MRIAWAATLCLVLSSLAQGQSVPARVAIAEVSIATLKVPGFPDFLAPDGNAVWVTNESRVEKLVFGAKKPVMTVPIPEPCGAMIVAFHSLWVASCRDKSIYRVNTSSGEISTQIATGLADPDGELSVAAGGGSVWILSDDSGVLSRIDPSTNKVIKAIKVKPHSYAAAFGFGRVWISNTGVKGSHKSGSVQCVDAATDRVLATIDVGPLPRFLAAGAGAVWVLNQGDGTVTRIDPDALRAVATIPTEMVGTGGDIDAGMDRVWIRGKQILLCVINPHTNRVTTSFEPPAGSGAVRVAEDLLWVSAHDVTTVWVLRPEMNY